MSTKPSHVTEKSVTEIPIKSRKQEIQEELARIEKEAGMFSNIGMTSPYWDLRKELQSMD